MEKFSNATVTPLANLYFGGKVISHTIKLQDGTTKTLGVVFPGTYHFATNSPERMEIIDGACEYSIDGSDRTKFVPTDDSFQAPGKSGFTITVNSGVCQYICTFLPS